MRTLAPTFFKSFAALTPLSERPITVTLLPLIFMPYLNFNVTSVNNASIADIIQKRTIILDSAQPFS